MAEKKSKNREVKVDSPILFIVVALLFLVSLGAIAIGFLNRKDEQAMSTTEIEISEETGDDEDLSDIFKKEFSKTGGEQTADEYYVSDPFKGVCAPSEGDDAPSVSSYIVCYR